MQPYYNEGGITIFNADCRDVLPILEPIDLVLADPPYPDYHTETYLQTPIDFLDSLTCRQLVFWSARAEFPLSYTAIHIWDKKIGTGGMYERIFERNGSTAFMVFRHYLINSTVAASFTRDAWTGHPSQKPIQLIRELVEKFSKPGDLVFEPFGGSGTTSRACKDLGRRCVSAEISERYCDIAAARLAQEVMQFEV